MTRHGKNNTASPCYTYHERQRDTRNSGYGTQRQRLNKDSVKDYDACSLTLQPCKQPVVTVDGVLFDKEAVLEYLIHKKHDALRQLKQWDKQNQRDKRELAELAEAEQRDRTDKFLALERSITNPSHSKSSSSSSLAIAGSSNASASVASVSNMTKEKSSQLPSFWIPSLTPQSKQSRLKKPSGEVLCPITGKPLKAKDLIPIKFTPIDVNARLCAAERVRYILLNLFPSSKKRPDRLESLVSFN
jgi:nitric oxide synthase-interacting protein